MENYFTRLAKTALDKQPVILPRVLLADHFQAEDSLPDLLLPEQQATQPTASTIKQTIPVKDVSPSVKKLEPQTTKLKHNFVQTSLVPDAVITTKEPVTQTSKDIFIHNTHFKKQPVLPENTAKDKAVVTQQPAHTTAQEMAKPSIQIKTLSEADKKLQQPTYKESRYFGELPQQIKVMPTARSQANEITPSADEPVVITDAKEAKQTVAEKKASIKPPLANNSFNAFASYVETLNTNKEPDTNISPLSNHLPQLELMALKQPLPVEKKIKINIMIGRLHIRGKQPISKKTPSPSTKISLTQYFERKAKEADSHE